MRADLRIAVVGATGAVGREALAILSASGHPAARVVAIASAASHGSTLAYGRDAIAIRGWDEVDLRAGDAALFAADATTAHRHAPDLARRGVVVVDNSSAFRQQLDVPLVVPEVNGAALPADARLVANPNCSTILLVLALAPLQRAFGITRVVVSTYQAVSGAGHAALDELTTQTRAVLDGGPAVPRVFHEPCAFNVFSHDSAVDPLTGHNQEETKLLRETRRILEHPDLQVLPTCVRVPVHRCHSQAITVTLAHDAGEDDVRAALAAADGLHLLDDRAGNRFPTPLLADGDDRVWVGRIRRAAADGDDHRTFALWLCGDQLRKGAARNALQVLDQLLG